MFLIPRKHKLKVTSLVFCFFVILIVFAFWTPKKFPIGSKFAVTKDQSLSETASLLYQKHIITSPLLFKTLVMLMHGTKGILAGDYVFNKAQSTWIVAYRMIRGEQGLERFKVTIPEGATVQDIGWILLKNIPDFNAPKFLELAKGKEGYLFPDTYFFYSNVTSDQVLKILEENFDDKINSLKPAISISGRSLADIVTMASIVEREATSTKDRAIIAGILWKRLDEGMLLQVDSPLVYITTDGYVSINDTKIDSKYNTYKNKGLPAGPISNPGIEALKAAVNPTATSYYYYLSDRRGNIHYAEDHEGHIANRDKYLNKI